MSEMSEHRVTMLGASWRHLEDPARSRDPRVRAVVSSLATLPGEAPRAEFRAELRAQLVAIAPRIVAESAGTRAGLTEVKTRPMPSRAAAETRRAAKHSDSFLDRVRGLRLGRPLSIAASIVTAFALLLGGAVWMSRDALPGDNLYGLKRASERVELATAGSDTEKARDHLKFAETRAHEVRALLSRGSVTAGGKGSQAAGLDPETARLVRSTLNSADSDVTAAAVLLGKQAVSKGSPAPLNAMTKWAPGQVERLRDIAAVMPSGALRQRTESSANLVVAALTRAETLAPKVDCSCLGSTGVDTLGPVPCTTCPASQQPNQDPTNPQQGAGGGKTGGTSSASAGAGGTGGTAPNSANTPHSSAIPNEPAASGSSSAGLPGLPLPSITLPTPSLPGVSSCSLGATLGPIIIGVGLCPLGVKVSLHP
jgi:hypothetical protein